MIDGDPKRRDGEASRLDWVAVSWILGFSVLCGSVSLIYPFGRDQGSYAYAGWMLLDGEMPYVDVYTFKPPMSAVVHALAMGVFGVNTWAIRAADVFWTAATGLVVAAVALQLWNRRDAAVAAGLAVAFFYYQIDYWTIAQTDGWMTLPAACGVWAALRGGQALPHGLARAGAWWVCAGACAAVAVLFKYTAGLIGLPVLFALGWGAAKGGRRAWLGLPATIFGGLLTLALCWAWLASRGAWDAFVDIQLSLAPYNQLGVESSSISQTLRWLFTLERTKTDLAPLVWVPFIAFVPAIIAARPRCRANWMAWGLVVTWWAIGFANVLVQGKFFDYHYLPLLAPSALIAGLGFSAVLRYPLSRIERPSTRRLIVTGLIAAAVIATPIGIRARELVAVTIGGQRIEEYIANRHEYSLPVYDVGEIRELADFVSGTTAPEQRIFLWGWEPTVYVRARRRTVSRFIYNIPLRARWKKGTYVTELMRELNAAPPELFIVGSKDPYVGYTGSKADSAESLRDFEELNAFVTSRYSLETRIGRYSVFRLQRRIGPPDIVLITVDTLRPDRLGAYGAGTADTPEIDALAAEGTTFMNAFVPMGRTTPALASMMTGLWPYEHGSREVREPITQGEVITEVLRTSGYATAGVVANPAAGRGLGLERGFKAFVQVGEQGPEERWDASHVTDHAIALTDAVPPGQPLFLWAHYLDPHWPYEAPNTRGHPETARCAELRENVSRGLRESNEGGLSERYLDDCRAAYDAEVTYTDTEIGRLLAELGKRKRLDDAIVLFTSDHGENFGEGGLFFAHGPNVHDASLRVPLIIVGADFEEGTKRSEVVRAIDVAPTLLELAEIPSTDWPPMKEAHSFVELSSEHERPSLLAFAESGGTLVLGNHSRLLSGRPRSGYCLNRGRYSLCWHGGGVPRLYDRELDPDLSHDLRASEPALYFEMLEAQRRWTPGKTRERSVGDGRFKLVERPRFEGGYARCLYDTWEDPAEEVDVQSSHPEVYERLASALDRWTSRIPGYVQPTLSEEAEAQLKALGYVE